MTSFDTWPPIGIAGTGSHAPEFDGDLYASSVIAARRALERADVEADDVDLLVVTAGRSGELELAAELGLRDDIAVVEFGAAGGGFVHGLHAGASMLAAGETWTYALVVEAGHHAGSAVLRKELEVADVIAMAAIDAGVDPGAAFDAGMDGGPLDEQTAGLRSVAYAHDVENSVEHLVAAACRDASVAEDELALIIANTPEVSVAAELDRLAREETLGDHDLVCLVATSDTRSAACVLRWSS
jgi:hypothetical protein